MRGRIVSHLLRRAWVANPEPRDEPAGLPEIEDILVRSGSAPLAWHVLRSERFHDVWRISRLHATRNRRRAAAAVAFFRERGIETLLIKGWAVARLYPDPALRPYTDTDLVVGRHAIERAEAVLQELPDECGSVDVHAHPEEWRDRTWDELFGRAERVDEFLVPSFEDHLRLLAIHAMKHGVFRPLWLCDLGLMLDTDFDWNLFSSGDRWLTDCAVLALRLAGSLLGAKIDGAPLRWAERAVLKEWGDPYRWPHGHVMMRDILRAQPASLVRELVRRWPGAIEATYNLRAPWNRMPRFPLQFAEAIRKLPAIPRQLKAKPGSSIDDRVDSEAEAPDDVTQQD